jgi:hypothetical protein
MNDIQIFNKIIPQGYANQIEDDVLAMKFPWYYIKDVTNKNYGSNSGLTHLAYNYGNEPSDWFPFIMPIVYSIAEAAGHELEQLLRIRVGCLPQTHEIGYEYNTPHLDFTMPHYTACYYVNDSDGDTVVFDQTAYDMTTTNICEDTLLEYVQCTNFTVAQRSTPKKGRLCIFDGLRFHASTKPKENDRRIVLTVNYIAR